MTNRIICHERETLLKLNFFQLVERYRSWGSVLISIYRLDAHDLKKTNKQTSKQKQTKKEKEKTEMRMRQSDKKRLRLSMNSALHSITTPLSI